MIGIIFGALFIAIGVLLISGTFFKEITNKD